MDNAAPQEQDATYDAEDSFGVVLPDSFRIYRAVLKRLWPGFLIVYLPLAFASWAFAELLLFVMPRIVSYMDGGSKVGAILSVNLNNLASSFDNLLVCTVGVTCTAAVVLAVREICEGVK